MSRKTLKDFPCPYTTEEKYEMICSGEYGVFEMYDNHGEISGYRGFRKKYGTTGIYDAYQSALEAAFTEFGDESPSQSLRNKMDYTNEIPRCLP